MKNVLLFLIIFNSPFIFSQEDESGISFNVNSDIVSRFVWRGLETGGTPSPHVQPELSIDYNTGSAGIISAGVWGTYDVLNSYDENDFYLNYTIPSPAGDFSLTFTDFFFPHQQQPITNFKGNGEGAHTVEASIKYSGAFDISVSNNIYNSLEDDKSLYIELGIPFEHAEFEGQVFAGAAQGTSLWHGIESNRFEVINAGLSITKQIKITEYFTVPLSVSVIENFYSKKSFVILGVSF